MVERVGILVVHGIGRHYRFEHLRNVVDNFVRAAAGLYGDSNVSVEIPGAAERNLRAVLEPVPGPVPPRGGGGLAPISVLIRNQGKEGAAGDTCIDFREVWWGDLSVGSGAFRHLQFWFWAISLSGTRGYFFKNEPGSELRSPSRRQRLSFRYRLELFAWTTLFFLLLLPTEVLARMIAFIPGARRFNVFGTVFSFMSAVKMYQERERRHGAELTDFDRARRASVERRMTNLLVDMAQDNYDRWYIFGHSLGSVVAYKSLMARGTTLARYMSINRWNAESFQPLKSSAPPGFAAPDEAKCPHWMPEDAALRRDKIFERFRGFFTYGSPLEIFAQIWPAIVPINLERAFPPGAEWINVYDPADVVAMRSVRSFDVPDVSDVPGDPGDGRLAPTNFPYASSRLAYQAHSAYFWLRKHPRPQFVSSIVEWVVGGRSGKGGAVAFGEVARQANVYPLSLLGRAGRIGAALLEGMVGILVGCALMPTALAYMAKLANVVVRFLASVWHPSNDARLDVIPDPDSLFQAGLDRIVGQPVQIATEVGLVLVMLLGAVLLMSTFHYSQDSVLDWIDTRGERKREQERRRKLGIAVWEGERLQTPTPKLLQIFAWQVLVLIVSAALVGSGYWFWPTPGESASPVSAAATYEQAVARAFDQLRGRPPLLRAFLQRLPKGADLHTHLAGAVYAESYIAWAAEDGLCIDAMTLVECGQDGRMRVADAIKDPAVYSRIVDAWSVRNLPPDSPAAHDQFFNAFKKFRLVFARRSGDMLAEVARNAAAQHVLYLEIMLTLQGDPIKKLTNGLAWTGDLGALQAAVLHNGLRDLLRAASDQLDAMVAREREVLQCDGVTPDPGCKVMIRYLQQVNRTYPPEQVFASLEFAEALVRADRRVAGLNLVGPEDDPTALRDYEKQMDMLDFLWGEGQRANVSLHAGELDLGLVPLKDLRSHIRLAVDKGHARRIGHGVALGFDDDPSGLLQELREDHVLVEINLTSNALILGVKGEDHPFVDYLQAGVPLAISTDDEGISRTDLTNEFERAVQAYHLGYLELKRLVRDSVAYSFLPGASLWGPDGAPEPVPECAIDLLGGASPSAACQALLDGSALAKAEWELEHQLTAFEAQQQGLDGNAW